MAKKKKKDKENKVWTPPKNLVERRETIMENYQQTMQSINLKFDGILSENMWAMRTACNIEGEVPIKYEDGKLYLVKDEE